MKGIPIKFRAKCIETDELITFELGECSAELRDDYLTVIQDEVYTILADTICQLVGYGKDGKEIYEGDAIIDTRDDNANFEKLIAKFGTRRACLEFNFYFDWVDKPPKNFLTTEEQLKKRADYIKGFVKGDSNEQT